MALEEMKQRKREEYEMQLFGRHSREAYDGMKTFIEEEIESLCEKLYTSIKKKYKLNAEELSILRTDAKQLIHTYENRAEIHTKELKKIVDKFIAVPNHLLLDEDKEQKVQVSQNDLDKMRWKIEDLQKRAKKATIFNAALRQELEIQEKFKACVESINESSKKIEDKTTLPCLENRIEKFTQESEKLCTHLNAYDSTTEEKNIYNPVIENLKEFAFIS